MWNYYDSVKDSDFIDVGNFEVGIYFRDRRAHRYPRRVATVLFRGCRARRTFRDMTTSVHAISWHIHFGKCPIRNIVTSGNVIS